MRVLGEDVWDPVRVAKHLGALLEPDQAVVAIDRGERPVNQDRAGHDEARHKQEDDARDRDAGSPAPARATRRRPGDAGNVSHSR